MSGAREKNIIQGRPRNIFLGGFMGTGKSSVGRALAARMKRDFVDLDELIEARQRRSIPDIFASDGEAFFRKLEKEALKDVCFSDSKVVSCGGGIVIDKENVVLMKQRGILVCLCAVPEVIYARTRAFSNRPLLNVPDPVSRIEKLLKQRERYYALADASVDTSSMGIGDAAAYIEKLYEDKIGKVSGKAGKK